MDLKTKGSSKKVIKIDKLNKTKTYDSISSAAKENGISRNRLSDLLKYNIQDKNGCKWLYYFKKMDGEKWIKIEDFYNVIPGHSISNKGRVKKLNGNLTFGNNCNGYKQTSLKCQNGNYKKFYLHRIVAFFFIDNPNNKDCVNHKDCNKINNDFQNLEWVSIRENSVHAVVQKKIKSLAVEQYDKISKNSIKKFISINDAARHLNIYPASISSMIKGKKSHAQGYYFRLSS